MSSATPRPAATAPAGGPGLLTRVAAVAVVVALACLAYYTVFSGPTTVAVNPPAKVSPAQEAAPPAGEPAERGKEGGGD